MPEEVAISSQDPPHDEGFGDDGAYYDEGSHDHVEALHAPHLHAHHEGPDEDTDPRRGLMAGIVVVVVGVVLAAGVLGVALWSYFRAEAPIEAGDCIRVEQPETVGEGPRIDRISCENADAYGVVVSQVEIGARDLCVDQPAAFAAVDEHEPELRTLCVAEIGTESEEAVNNLADGECVIADGDRPRKVDCDEPGALESIGVLHAPPGVPNYFAGGVQACEEAMMGEADELLTWGLEDPASGSPVAPLRGACLVEPGSQ